MRLTPACCCRQHLGSRNSAESGKGGAEDVRPGFVVAMIDWNWYETLDMRVQAVERLLEDTLVGKVTFGHSRHLLKVVHIL